MAPKRRQMEVKKSVSKERTIAKKSPKHSPAVPLPFWLWVFKHTQGVLTVATTVGVLYYRNVHSVYYVASILSTSFLAKGLKLVIKQPRPPGSSVTKTHGMPSTHSSTTMFMGTYLSLALLYLPSTISSHHRHLIIPALLTLPPLIMYSRVRLGVHTVAQCCVGGLLGITNAVFCSAVWQGWGRFGVGLARSSWVIEADEYLGIAQELAKEYFQKQ
ncbi:hypothetical protein CBS101457_000554 [Exobasidium rhododendri]|nr:hypothetical protein CBS101457_000554 [Exobasidium rhododendri]